MLTLDHDNLVISFPEIHLEAKLRIAFQRTLRIPDDNRSYPLPPGLGAFPVQHVDDHAERLPAAWREHGGVFFPMYQAEAMWINFSSLSRYPFAVKIAIGKINAVNGKAWHNELDFDDQDYVVVPGQPWLDGFCISKNLVRQFVAMPLGDGYTAEEQLTGKAEHGGLQLIVYPLKTEHYQPPRTDVLRYGVSYADLAGRISAYRAPDRAAMGLAPGGLMDQQIYADPYNRDAWRTDVQARCFAHLLNSAQYRRITGQRPPTQPPTAADYTRAGLPWFNYYQDAPTVAGGEPLKKLDSVAALGVKKGQKPLPENSAVLPTRVKQLGTGGKPVRNGDF
jgi:hypothetical protein